MSFSVTLKTSFWINVPLKPNLFFYRRYLDDTFILFKTATEAIKFYDYPAPATAGAAPPQLRRPASECAINTGR